MTDFEFASLIYQQAFKVDAGGNLYLNGMLEALSTLTKQEQDVLIYRFRKNMSYAKTGENMGVDATQVRRITYRALEKLASSDINMDVANMIKNYEMEMSSKDKTISARNKTINVLFSEIENILRGNPISASVKTALEKQKMTIKQLGLKPRTCDAYSAAGIKLVEQLLVMKTIDDLKKLSGVGKGARTELYAQMRVHEYGDWADNMENQE